MCNAEEQVAVRAEPKMQKLLNYWGDTQVTFDMGSSSSDPNSQLRPAQFSWG